MKVKILQLDENIDNVENILFRDYNFVKSQYLNRNDLLKLYKIVYEIEDYNPVIKDAGDQVICDDIFVQFNLKRPEDFRGHSLSMSDIIQLDDKYYYVDAIGFVEI